MSRIFAYCRVSVDDSTNENQIEAIKNAGYTIPKTRIIEEVVSGSVAAMERKEFSNLVTHKLEGKRRLSTVWSRIQDPVT